MYTTDILIYRSFSLIYVKFDDYSISYELPFECSPINIISNYNFSIKDNFLDLEATIEEGLPFLIIKINEIFWKSKYILFKNNILSQFESRAYIENKFLKTFYFDNIFLIFRKQDYDNKHYPTDLEHIDHHHIKCKHKDLPNLSSNEIIKFKVELKKINKTESILLWKHLIEVHSYYPLYIMNKSKHLNQIIEFISPDNILPGELEIYDKTHEDTIYSVGSFDTTYFNKNDNVRIIFPKTNDLQIGYQIDDHVHLFKSRIDINVKLKIINKSGVKGNIKLIYPSKKIVTSYPEHEIEKDWIFWLINCETEKFEITITESS
jgi:hypothetical protein